MKKSKKELQRLSQNNINALIRIQKENNFRSIDDALTLLIEERDPSTIEKLKQKIVRARRERDRFESEKIVAEDNYQDARSDYIETLKAKEHLEIKNVELRNNFKEIAKLNEALLDELRSKKPGKFREYIKALNARSEKTQEVSRGEVIAFNEMSMQDLISKVDSTKISIDACMLSLQDNYNRLIRMQPPGVD